MGMAGELSLGQLCSRLSTDITLSADEQTIIHLLIHFVTDADVRANDLEYDQYLRSQLEAMLAEIKIKSPTAMTSKSRDKAQIALDAIYEEGGVDWISFGQILGAVTYGAADDDLGKTEAQRLKDAFSLVEFLNGTGDFDFGELSPLETEGTGFRPFQGGVGEFIERINELVLKNGLSDADVLLQFWLNQTHPGKSAPIVDEKIARALGF